MNAHPNPLSALIPPARDFKGVKLHVIPLSVLMTAIPRDHADLFAAVKGAFSGGGGVDMLGVVAKFPAAVDHLIGLATVNPADCKSPQEYEEKAAQQAKDADRLPLQTKLEMLTAIMEQHQFDAEALGKQFRGMIGKIGVKMETTGKPPSPGSSGSLLSQAVSASLNSGG